MKDYYRALGVLDDAEDIIIRAAYKALAQRYHPDKWKGNLQDANKKMADINEAYNILSDPTTRKKYDAEYFRNRPREESAEDQNEDESNLISEENDAWQMALEFYPSIVTEYKQLKMISNILANTYRAILINRQEFNQSLKIKNQLEKEYLSRYYGADEMIQTCAKKLLLSNEKKAAIRVNKIVRLMGESVNAVQLVDQIIKEYSHLKKEDLLDTDAIQEQIHNKTLDKEEIFKIIKILFPTSQDINHSFSLFSADFIFKFTVGGVRHQYYKEEIVNLYIKSKI